MRGLIPLAALLPAAAVAAPDGKAIFTRCAACHTATGAGVPGAYPPLGADFRALAAKPEGRRYLALAVIKGLAGPLTIEGKPYRGVMPAQGGLDEASVAAVLNHVGTAIAKTGPAFKPFSAAEIAGYKAKAGSMTGADVAKLHATAEGK
ncbi:c-type cytochrome [Sphingomonas lycopersici]|uniref:Cytochrome c n=1 Tax=Sphingomonas lycopersici TaxID=2951807 RepID=A0AA41Z7A7_9SPHN|nr:cytochrome c [Sphingomonas lycopersici]MCW6534162.1 cytochrome c [Sphingomonas lycopersici]